MATYILIDYSGQPVAIEQVSVNGPALLQQMGLFADREMTAYRLQPLSSEEAYTLLDACYDADPGILVGSLPAILDALSNREYQHLGANNEMMLLLYEAWRQLSNEITGAAILRYGITPDSVDAAWNKALHEVSQADIKTAFARFTPMTGEVVLAFEHRSYFIAWKVVALMVRYIQELTASAAGE